MEAATKAGGQTAGSIPSNSAWLQFRATEASAQKTNSRIPIGAAGQRKGVIAAAINQHARKNWFLRIAPSGAAKPVHKN
jgi:hypothetical protein